MLSIDTQFQPVRSGTSTLKVESDHQIKEKLMPEGENLSSIDMELTVLYVDHTQRNVPFIDFMISLNPPVRVSSVYAGCTVLLSERGHNMCLVKLANMAELYGTEMFAVDKITREMYAVVGGAANKIDLQAYTDEEMKDSPGAVRFTPIDISMTKDVEILSKP